MEQGPASMLTMVLCFPCVDKLGTNSITSLYSPQYKPQFFFPKSELLHVLKLPSIVSLHLKQAEFTFLGNTDTEDEIEDKRRKLWAQGLEP